MRYLQATECTWSHLVLGHRPPRCLVDIPDSVSSLCLRPLSGQLGLKQHDPRSAVQPLPTLCADIYSMCVCGCVYPIHTHVLDMRGATFIRFSLKNRPTKRETLYLGKYRLTLTCVEFACCCGLFFFLYLRSSGCGLDVESY